MKNEKVLAGVIIGIGFLFAIYFFSANRENVAKNFVSTPTPTPKPVASTNISVNVPAVGQAVSQEFDVKGKARVFENIVSIRVKNKVTNDVYVADATTAYGAGMGQFADFVYTVKLDNKPNSTLRAGDSLILEVYQASAKDGSEQDLVSIPLRFTPN